MLPTTSTERGNMDRESSGAGQVALSSNQDMSLFSAIVLSRVLTFKGNNIDARK